MDYCFKKVINKKSPLTPCANVESGQVFFGISIKFCKQYWTRIFVQDYKNLRFDKGQKNLGIFISSIIIVLSK